jgi:hypothetical protein
MKTGSYNKCRKWCEVCNKHTSQILETTVSTCTVCDTTFDDDADELFGTDTAVE